MSKEITIKNEFVEATISTKAAEVISFKKLSDNLETIWCRNPEFWRNCNPILFPYTGPLIDGKYTYEGREYFCGQHGFTRDAEFTITEAGKQEAELVLQSDFSTLRVYPFAFTLTVRYTLEGHKLLLNYRITNRDDKPLPFNIGFHPAFNCPVDKNESFSDYCIEFQHEETLMLPDKVIPNGKYFSLKDVSVSPSFFYHNSQIKSDWVQLTNGKHTVRVGIAGYQTLGFWRKNENAPYVCIEPWHPVNDLPKANTFRPDSENNLLAPNTEFECGYYFEII